MLFNSLEFLIFFPVVFILYWFVFNRSLKIQNSLLLIASYFFYACWDWRFMFLLAFSTFICYYSGLKIYRSNNPKHRKYWLWLGVSTSLGLLGFFKYFNFFIESLSELLLLLGFTPHLTTLYIILPVGISFYTFHGLSYIFDVYNGKTRLANNWIDYSLFVSFFPLLVAGPIERATHLLPQIQSSRSFEYSKALNGMRQILWGFFKKVVIADSCAVYVDQIFNGSAQYTGSTLILGAVLFSFQIYGDFSGYTDIALGTARLMGFELLRNFNYPYFSRDISEFWRRWHISLSTWFRDYLYIPLGGGRCGKWKKLRNIYIVFLVSGLWHGANWTFLSWGLVHAMYMTPIVLFRKGKKNTDTVAAGRMLPNMKEVLQILFTFALTVLARVLYRAGSLEDSFFYLKGIFTTNPFSLPEVSVYSLLFLIAMFMIIEWIGRESNFAIENIQKQLSWRPIRWVFYLIIILFIFANTGQDESFIYFQF